ncbi:MAG TPA: VOC family protein [Vicinamibacterales bacterium]|nr:VOC family protein [Vicinamibacterales bacterium]
MVSGIAHIGITVIDFDRMLGFYRDVLGLTVDSIVPQPDGGRRACLRGTERETIEIIQHRDPKPHQGRDLSRTGIHHFGFVVEDVHGYLQRLERLGVEIDGDVTPNAKGDLVVQCWDPEGNRLHFTQLALTHKP